MYSSYQSDPLSDLRSHDNNSYDDQDTLIESSTNSIHHNNADDSSLSAVKKPSTFVNFVKLLTVTATLAIVILVGLTQVSPKVSKLLTVRKSSTDLSAVTMTFSSVHPDYGNYDLLMSFVPWDAVVEPHQTQTLSISSFQVGDKVIEVDESTFHFTWTIGDQTYGGPVIQYTAKNTGVTTATITATSTVDSSISYTTTMKLASKYVRREVRKLTDDDRESFLNAMQTLYKVSTTDGKALYGDDYISAADLLVMHLNGAGRTDCDHWHDGAGIVNHHAAISMTFERALQSINPKLSLAYWEYAQDGYNFDNWYDSTFFQDEWFGKPNPTSADHAVDTGRWAYTEMPDASYLKPVWSIADSGSLNPFVNGYGHMRSPWNNNPSKYLSRYNMTYGVSQKESLPNCVEIQSCYESASLSSTLNCLNGVSHGPVHVLIGGAWSKSADDASTLKSIDRVLLFKMLWRAGYARCPESCEEGETCSCSIPEEYVKEYGLVNILKSANVYDLAASAMPLDSDDHLLIAKQTLEDPGIAGDMYSSAASYDPTFWPLHGQIERVLGLKRILISQGVLSGFDESWGFDVTDSRYTQGHCDWSAVTDTTDLTLPTCDFSSDSYCWGHEEDDEVDNSNFMGTGNFKNKDFYDFIHPWTDDLSYIYDTYNFDYCSDLGFDFGYNTETLRSNHMLKHRTKKLTKSELSGK